MSRHNRELLLWLDSYSELLATTRWLAHLAERLVEHASGPGMEIANARSELRANRTVIEEIEAMLRTRRC